MNKLLCGLPGCGKTTIGKLLAEKLAYSFIDTDCLIERHFSMPSCREIFLQLGEKAFREIETETLESLRGCNYAVIALGGGVLETPGNDVLLQGLGEVVYLRASVEVIWSRLLKKALPAYLDPKDLYGSFIDLARRRGSLYEKVAGKIVDTDYLTQEDIVGKILNLRNLEVRCSC